MNKILSVNKVSKNYHSIDGEYKAIDEISFDCNDGEFIVVLGPSGSGKSTLISMIAGLLDVSSGSVDFYIDNPVIGYMFQEDALFDHLKIIDNLLLGLKIKGKDGKKLVLDLVSKYGLEDALYKYPKELSGGMRQRCALIRTLAILPDILILDEPFSALDYKTRLMVADDVYKIIKNEKKTTIMVTHDISEAISMADKIIVLSSSPATVKNIYEIDIDDSIPSLRRNNSKFTYYYDLIWNDLNE